METSPILVVAQRSRGRCHSRRLSTPQMSGRPTDTGARHTDPKVSQSTRHSTRSPASPKVPQGVTLPAIGSAPRARGWSGANTPARSTPRRCAMSPKSSATPKSKPAPSPCRKHSAGPPPSSPPPALRSSPPTRYARCNPATAWSCTAPLPPAHVRAHPSCSDRRLAHRAALSPPATASGGKTPVRDDAVATPEPGRVLLHVVRNAS